MCDEWHVPDGIPIIPVYDYVKNPDSINDFEKGLNKPEILRKEIDSNKEWMKKRVVVKEFLEEMFQYNPDAHVRSSYQPQVKDTERKIVKTPAAQLAVSELKNKDVKFNEEMLQFDREEKVTGEENSVDIKTEVEKTVYGMIPPADLFHRFDHYRDVNYEVLHEATLNLYCEKPDLEKAINPYAWHDNVEDADKFIAKHKNEVITTIYKAHSGKWNFFSPFKQVRDSTRYFNDKTVVLEEIMKQIEKDSKLGQDLMKKRIKVKKKKNIEECGPDDEAFTKWKEGNSTLKDMGAESINKNSYASEECPDNAIEVPVFRISNGGTKMEKTKFFTKAEAPTWMADNE
jgi:hypothetical protein